MDFENTYNNTSDRIKLKFLDAIIRHNEKLKKEFVAYAGNNSPSSGGFSYPDFVNMIESTQKDYQEQFEKIDTENPDWDNYHPPHPGYIPDYEAYQYASEQEFESIIEYFVNSAIDKVIEQKPCELLAMFAGLYEATQNTEIEDSIDSFDDINEYLLELFSGAMLRVVDKISLSAVSDKDIGKAFQLFFKHCDHEYPGNPSYPGYYEPLLLALAKKSDTPAYLLETFNNEDIEQSSLPELTLYLNKASGNREDWLNAALQMYKNSQPVAKELLQHYFDTEKTAFIALAKELFDKDENAWDKFLKEYMSPELNKNLFVKVYRRHVAKTRSMSDYLTVQEHLTPNDVDVLLSEIRWDYVFKAKILEAEQRYADIKQMLEENVTQRHFAGVIQPILHIFPEFCFKQIKDKATGTLQTERGRDVYEQIAGWLKLAREIPGFETDALQLIQQLYTHKPNLPALKDEMRKAGLVK